MDTYLSLSGSESATQIRNGIEFFSKKAHDLALKRVEYLARKALRKYKCIDYFVMGLGTVFFVLKDGTKEPISQFSIELCDFIAEFDNKIHILDSKLVLLNGKNITKKTDW